MGDTKIQWADKVWNPVTGCSKISPGCQNCYAEKMAKRLGGRHGYPADDPFRVTVHQNRLEEPYRWKKAKRIFICSMADLFHDDVPDEFILKVFNVMANAQWFFKHTFLVLTKRPERMKKIMEMIKTDIDEQRKPIKNPDGTRSLKMIFSFPLEGIWLGVTAENQEMANKRIPILLQIPAAVRFVSVEPMLGPMDLSVWLEASPSSAYLSGKVTDDLPAWTKIGCEALDWVIVGGETGPNARKMEKWWLQSIVSRCLVTNTPIFVKQISGRNHNYRHYQLPDWANVKQFPRQMP